MWAAQYFDFREPRLWLTSGSMGTMGFGLPAAIGAQFARRDRLVIDIDGDASIRMNLGELETVTTYDLPVKVVVLNNFGDGMVKQWQKLFFKGRLSASDKSLHKKDFVKAAQADGFRLRRAARPQGRRAARGRGVHRVRGPGVPRGDHRSGRRRLPDGRPGPGLRRDDHRRLHRVARRAAHDHGAGRVGDVLTPTFAEAARFWVRLGFISFGGPAGQIAILHREVVERRRWLDERDFTRALNFCMLLPGPEALQLAIYLGWKLHGVRGGLVAGLGFILPAVVLLFALSYVYVAHGSRPGSPACCSDCRPPSSRWCCRRWCGSGAVRCERRCTSPSRSRRSSRSSSPVPVPGRAAGAASSAPSAAGRRPACRLHDHEPDACRAIAQGRRGGPGALAAPLLLVAATLGVDSLWSRVYLFFTKAALVTFGGAYAVLGYVTTQLVDKLALVTAEQSVAGLALAETTPGPLVIVLQFMGFMAGWNQPGPFSPLGSALLAGALATWATFLPSFVFILLGAPYVERLTRNARIEAALGAITAAVVGVIATLALLLAQVVLFPDGWRAAPDWSAVVIAVAAWFLLERARWPLPWVLAAAARPGYCCACCSSASSRCWNTSNGLAPEITSPSNSPLTTRPITNVGVDVMPLEAASATSARTAAARPGRRGSVEAVGVEAERARQLRVRSCAESDWSRNSASRYSQYLPCWPAQRAATAAGSANACIGSGRSRVANRTLPVST